MSENALATVDRPLTNQQKVAILLASLKESTAAVILQRLSPTILSQVADALRRLGVVPGDVRQRVVAECLRGIMDSRDTIEGSDQIASNLLTQAIGEKRAVALLQDPSAKSSAFSGLSKMNAEQILSVLGREQPSIIAMVMRYLPPILAAQVLNLAPREIASQVMVILCTGRPPSEAALMRAQEFIEARLGKSPQIERAASGDVVARASLILQTVDYSLAEDILQALDKRSPVLCSELRDRLFSFDDIALLSDGDMRRIMQEVDMSGLAIALRGASVNVTEKFFANMSKRAAEGLKEDMQYAPKMKFSEVEAKRKEIIGVIRDLDAQGEISLQGGEKNEYI